MKNLVSEKISSHTASIKEIAELNKERLIQLLQENIKHQLLGEVIGSINDITFVTGKAYSLFDYDLESNKINLTGLLKTYSDTRLKKNIFFIFAGLVKFNLLKNKKDSKTFDPLTYNLCLGLFYEDLLRKYGKSYSDEEKETKIYKLITATFRDQIKSFNNYIPAKIYNTNPKDIDFNDCDNLTYILKENIDESFTIERLKIFTLLNYSLFNLFNDDFHNCGYGFYADDIYRSRRGKLVKMFNKRFEQIYIKKGF